MAERGPDPGALALLRATLQAIEPWSDRVVIIGGWAMQMYRYLDWADASVAVHHTKDVDVAVARPRDKLVGLPERLRQQGLVGIPSRATDPAITTFQAHHHGVDRRAPEYVEFMVPQVGKDQRVAVEIAPGIGAQTLRYLDLSFAQVRRLFASQVPYLSDLGRLQVPVPSPASYLLAKSLVFDKRKHDEKRDGDCAYLYWLARLTRRSWPELRANLAALEVPSAWRRRGHRWLRRSFATPVSDGTVRAVRSIASVDHDAAIVHAVMQRFLAAILPSD